MVEVSPGVRAELDVWDLPPHHTACHLVATGSAERVATVRPMSCTPGSADDLRETVRRQVAAHTGVDRVERRMIERFLELFDGLESPLDQRADAVHVTGSAFVVGRRGVVLLRHRRLGIWLQPGGHIDPGETPWEAALREAREETGLDLAPIDFDAPGRPRLAHVDVHAGGRGHTHLDLRYVVGGDDSDPSPPPDESQQIGWFSVERAVELAGDRRLAAALARLGGR